VEKFRTDITVIGGGVIGCSIAYHLAKEGGDVVVLEGETVASGASGRNAGGVRKQGRNIHEFPFAIESSNRFLCLNDELGLELEYRRDGNVQIAFNEDQMETLRDVLNKQEKWGFRESKLLDRKGVEGMVPLMSLDGVVGGIYCPTDGHINPLLLNFGFAEKAKRLGAKIRSRSPVKKILLSESGERVIGVSGEGFEIRSNWVINATGIHARQLSKTIGCDVPIQPVTVEMVVTEPLPPILKPYVMGMQSFGCRQTMKGNLLFIYSGPTKAMDSQIVSEEIFKRRIGLLSLVFKKLKSFSVIRSWAGCHDLSEDRLPIIHFYENPKGYVIAAGFSGHGMALSPAFGESISETLLKGKATLSLEHFSLSRFGDMDYNQFGKGRKYLSTAAKDKAL
jgi:sarcosine oxidase subunit beta